MKLLECNSCGSKEIVEEQGYAVCVFCRSKFLPGAEDGAPPETEIAIDSDIQALLIKCRADPANSRRYANLILDIDPTNREAAKYLR